MKQYPFPYVSIEDRLVDLENKVNNLTVIVDKLIVENVETTNELYMIENMIDTIVNPLAKKNFTLGDQ